MRTENLGGELDIYPDIKTHLVPMIDLVEWVERNKEYATHFEVYFSRGLPEEGQPDFLMLTPFIVKED